VKGTNYTDAVAAGRVSTTDAAYLAACTGSVYYAGTTTFPSNRVTYIGTNAFTGGTGGGSPQTNIAHNSLLGIEGAGTLHVSAGDTNLIKTALQAESDTLQTVVTRGGTATGTITVADVNITGSSTVYDPTTIVYPTLKTLLDYPNIGPTQSQYRDKMSNDPFILSDCNILYLGAGKSGVTREIFLTPVIQTVDAGGFTFSRVPVSQLSNLFFRVWVDAGNIADFANPPAEKLAVSIPISDIAGSLATQTNTLTRIEFDAFESQVVNANGTNINFSVSWQIPMPFTNGILVQIGVMTNGTWFPRVANYNTATYELGALPSGRLGRMRVKSSTYNGRMLVDGQTPVLISEPSGYGALAIGFSGSRVVDVVDDTPVAAIFESNWAFIDGSSVTNTYSGSEDILGAMAVFGFAYAKDGTRNGNASILNVSYGLSNWAELGSGLYFAFSMQRRPAYWRNGVTATKVIDPYWYDTESIGWVDSTLVYYQEVGQ
jgi:hypothetical protein